MDSTFAGSDGVVVAQFEKKKKEEVRVSIETFNGRKFINIRVFYKDDDGEWKPGKQGLAVSVDRYKDLAGSVLEVGQYLKANGLIQN